MLRDALRKAAAGEPLSAGEAERSLEEIMEGTANPAVTAALLTALRVKGESVGEIVGFARSCFNYGLLRGRVSPSIGCKPLRHGRKPGRHLVGSVGDRHLAG